MRTGILETTVNPHSYEVVHREGKEILKDIVEIEESRGMVLFFDSKCNARAFSLKDVTKFINLDNKNSWNIIEMKIIRRITKMRTGVNRDEWFHGLCMEVAKASQCLSRKIGSVLVRDNSIISTGYNGPPRGVRTCDERWLVVHDSMRKAVEFPVIDENSDFYKDHLEGKCPRYVPEFGFKSGEGLEWCVAGHAERNSLINAARFGITTKGTTMYMDCGTPCTPCMVEIINAGVEEIVITREHYYDQSAEYLLKESGLKWRIYDHLKG